MTLAMVRAASHEDLSAERILLRRRVRDWRDHWSLEAELQLRGLLAARASDLDAQITNLSHKDLALARTGYSPMPILVEIVDAATMAADRLVAEAQAALAPIVTHHLEFEARAGASSGTGGLSAGDVASAGITAAPIAMAVGLGFALPGLATTTSVAMLGLVTTSAVSAPILLAGIGGVAALSAFGVVRLSGLRADQERRLTEAIHSELEARLFAPLGQGAEPSLSARLEAGFARVANELTEAY
jgi:hypothetical protein